MKIKHDLQMQPRAAANIALMHGLFTVAFFFVSFIFLWSTKVMAADSEASLADSGKFTLLWSGGHDWGSREISFDGNRRFYYAIGDTLRSDTQTGVGAFQLDLQNADLEEAKTAANILCDKSIQKDDFKTTDSPAIFSVTCFEGGVPVTKKGILQAIPDDLRGKLFVITSRLSDKAYLEGRRLTKLDFTPYKVEYRDGKFIVSVRFINSGSRWIKFATPDQWQGTTWGGRLGIGAINKIGANGVNESVKGSWGFALGGQTLINRDEFSGGVVILNPGESKILKFQTIPDNKASKGEYEFSGVAFMNIECEGGGAALSGLVVLGPIKTRITIDRDYPSTPEERQQWEATHRASMSSRPVKSGETFAEDGLYRAAGMSFSANQRSLQVKPFKAGDLATTENVKMLMDGGNGLNINGPVQWMWEATAPTPIKQYSFDMIDDTRQFCAAGSTCPRSGRWLARTLTERLSADEAYRYDFTRIVTLRRGDAMPAGDGNTDWEWVGA
ncbi:hypothetical protein [Burkholderia sp. 4M9327F10]|uniref:hypothetical protein n=1 Tax=Burkholderia sp. 4M9327F10 TaxID=2502223 RepID=UPI0010F71A7C|nr:hypothetical protein [Burkholderia sp. 4M9327F10]